MLKAFREKDLPVIFVNVLVRPPLTDNLPKLGRLWEETGNYKPEPGDLGVIPALKHLSGEPVLTNWPFTAFSNSGLQRALRLCRAETLVIEGVVTNGAVYGTTSAAADRFIIPRDASASPSEEDHRAVMEIMAPAVALVTRTEDVIRHLE